MFVGNAFNAQGVLVSLHRCDTCGREFTVCPPIAESEVEEKGWENCLDPSCESYDPMRDVDLLMGWSDN